MLTDGWCAEGAAVRRPVASAALSPEGHDRAHRRAGVEGVGVNMRKGEDADKWRAAPPGDRLADLGDSILRPVHAPAKVPLAVRLSVLVTLALVTARAAVAQSAANLRAAARYSAERAGEAVLVFRRDSLVFEQYQNGYDGRLPHPLASGTKTFSCVLAALGQADSLLELDEPVAGTLAEFRNGPLERRVTIRELLNLTSGLEPDSTTGELAMAAPPGQRFAYGGAGFEVFGAVMSRKLHGEDLVAYLTRRIFAPLGSDVAYWPRDAAGHPYMAGGVLMTARAWGRFGLLLLDRGRWHGRQLVPSAALSSCGRGSAANPGYGLGAWLNAPAPPGPPPPGVHRAGRADRLLLAPDLPHDLWLAAGTGGQRLYILPSAGLVVVRFGHNTGPDYKDDAFLRILLGG
jgi:CubicO group peptidase (beta-lactamase class C family)